MDKAVLFLNYVCYYNATDLPNHFNDSIDDMEFSSKWSLIINYMKQDLHQEILLIVNMLFDKNKLISPYRGYYLAGIQSNKISSNISVSQTTADLEMLRVSLQNLLHNLTNDFYSREYDNELATKRSRSSLESLKLTVRKQRKEGKILDIFRNNASFMTGLLVCLILKEICLVVGSSYFASLRFDIELNSMFLLNETLSDDQRSCLLWFSSAITFNPYPVSITEIAVNLPSNMFWTSMGCVKAFCDEQSDSLKSAAVTLSVAEGSKKIFVGQLHQNGDPTTIALSKNMMFSSLGCCSSFIKYHERFVQLCDSAPKRMYRVCVLPTNIIATSLNLLSTVFNTATASRSKEKDRQLFSAVYLFAAITLYLTKWLKFHIALSKEEYKSMEGDAAAISGLDCDTISFVKDIRKIHAQEIENFIRIINADVLPNMKVIFAKSSLHSMDSLKETFSLTADVTDDLTWENYPNGTNINCNISQKMEAIGKRNEITKSLMLSSCCVAIVKGLSGFVECLILHNTLCNINNFVAINIPFGKQFDVLYSVIGNLENTISLDNINIVRQSQTWYKCIYVTPIMTLLLNADLDSQVDALLTSSSRIDMCIEHPLIDSIDIEVLAALQTINVSDIYVTFILNSLLDPVKSQVNKQIGFNRYCKNLFVFSCGLLRHNGKINQTGRTLAYAKAYVQNCIDVSFNQTSLFLFTAQWNAAVVRSFISAMIHPVNVQLVNEMSINLYDVIQRYVFVSLSTKYFSNIIYTCNL